jgi:hypothetical protein
LTRGADPAPRLAKRGESSIVPGMQQATVSSLLSAALLALAGLLLRPAR